ncbi:hypothetical protein [Tahibacter caeni]|uniref:hypothetical protein n=1 Tax=Tahibacter caeni TaxID=1453545 RepID=UPI00214762D1|nr:hypothetical protein [Tahibacter caeni]
MSIRPSRHSLFPRCLIGLGLLLPALPGHAFSVCVGTAQQLHDALVSAEITSDTNVVIKIRTGTYIATAATGSFKSTVSHSNQVVEVSGGWSGPNNSCQDKTFNSAATILVGPADRIALHLSTNSAISGSTLHAHDLTLSSPGYTGTSLGACLNTYVTAGNEALLERLQMVECLAPNGYNAAGYLENTAGLLTVRDVFVRSSSAKSNGGLSVSTYDGGTSRIAHLSVANTVSSAADSLLSGLYIANFGNSFTYLGNSVFWGNDPDPTTADLSVFGSGVFLTRTHYGSLRGTPAANLSPSSGDPGFVAYNNPRPRADSILVDSGIANPQGGSGTFDADGRTRVLGPAVDIGAFESELIFADGFQTTAP